jgi:thymidylate kinase
MNKDLKRFIETCHWNLQHGPPKARAPIILIEGLDFSGKSTIVSRIEKELTWDGQTYIGKAQQPSKENSVREIVLNNDKFAEFFPINVNTYSEDVRNKTMDLIEFYMFMASRAHSLEKVFSMAMNKIPVIMDRGFPSTMVYQKHVGPEYVLKHNIDIFNHFNELFGLKDYKPLPPDLIIFLNIQNDTYLSRLDVQGVMNDYDTRDVEEIETRRKDYLKAMEMIKSHPNYTSKVVTLSADEEYDVVYEKVCATIASRLLPWEGNYVEATEG